MTIYAGQIYTAASGNASAYDVPCNGQFIRKRSLLDGSFWMLNGRWWGGRGLGPFWLRMPNAPGYFICTQTDPAAPDAVPPFYNKDSPPPGASFRA